MAQRISGSYVAIRYAIRLFFTGDNLATYDCVIANPPFSMEKWGEEVWSSDP